MDNDTIFQVSMRKEAPPFTIIKKQKIPRPLPSFG